MEGGNRAFRVNFTSEGVSKLREAINEKLKEFMGDYTDDTLVEYVLVLLKNGRSKDEAKSELNVFLGDDDSDSFVSWLWDHLGSSLSLYVELQEPHPDGPPKTKSKTEDENGNTKSRQHESEAEKVTSVKANVHPNKRHPKVRVRDEDENEVHLSRKSVADNEISQDELHRVGRTKPSLSPRPSIHKKRRSTEEQQPRKRVVSQSSVSAPRRLLQFAVRDAVGTSRPFNATSEISLKRLRSVVSTSVGDLLQEEQKPSQRIRRTSMSAAIKAAAEAVMDVNKVRPSRSVFNRLGHAIDVSNTTHHKKHGPIVEDVEFSRGLEGHALPFHDNVLDSVLGYDDDGGYDDIDDRDGDATDKSLLGKSDMNWMEKNSLTDQYDDGAGGDTVDGMLLGPSEDLGPPVTGHNASLRIASSVSVNNRRSQYQEGRVVFDMDNRKRVLGSAVSTKSEVRLMSENRNPTLAFNGNSQAKPDATQQQPEKTRTPTGLQNTGPPTEDADSRTIFISNVHFAATKDSLSRHFNKFGEVLKVIILTDPATGQPKGSAYIEFMRKEAAELALSLDGTSFMSRLLKVVKKSSAQPEAAPVVTWPHIARAPPFPVPRFSRGPFARGLPNIYRAHGPAKPGARSFQWKRGAEASPQVSNSYFPTPTTRGLTYVRAEANKTNGSSAPG